MRGRIKVTFSPPLWTFLANNGPGIATGGNVNIREWSVCGNTTDVLRGGEANLENVTVCKESSIIELPGEAATASTTADEKPEPAPNADASVQPDGDTPQEGGGGAFQPADDSSGVRKGGGCNAFSEGLIYVDGSWLALGILSLGMVFVRLRKNRRP